MGLSEFFTDESPNVSSLTRLLIFDDFRLLENLLLTLLCMVPK